MRIRGRKESPSILYQIEPYLSNERTLFSREGGWEKKKNNSPMPNFSHPSRKHNPPMFSSPSKYLSKYQIESLAPFLITLKVLPFFLLKKVWKCFKPFRERAGVVREWHFPSSCRAEGREPWVPPGYPKKSGFLQGSWTRF